MGAQIDINPVSEPADIEPILSHLGADGGVIFNADAFTNNNLKLEIDLAARYGVPAIYGGGSGGAKAGGLISYNLDVPAQVRQIAPYFDRILGGGESSRSSGSTADAISVPHQPQDREGTRPRRTDDDADDRRRGD